MVSKIEEPLFCEGNVQKSTMIVLSLTLVCFRILLLKCLDESLITGTKMAQIAALSPIGCNLRAIAAIFALNIDLCRRISAKKITKMCCRGPGYSGGAGANNNKQGSN